MKMTPDALLWHAKLAGLTLKRSPRDTILVFGDMDDTPEDWKAVLLQHKAVLLPLLPLHPEPKPRHQESVAGADGQYDLFGQAAPVRLRNTKRQHNKGLPLGKRCQPFFQYALPLAKADSKEVEPA